LQARFGCVEVIANSCYSALIAFFLRHGEEFECVAETAGQGSQSSDDSFQFRAFAPKLLCAFRFVPDLRIFEFAPYFDQPIGFLVEVKDTS
jgi:hypothetical protein